MLGFSVGDFDLIELSPYGKLNRWTICRLRFSTTFRYWQSYNPKSSILSSLDPATYRVVHANTIESDDILASVSLNSIGAYRLTFRLSWAQINPRASWQAKPTKCSFDLRFIVNSVAGDANVGRISSDARNRHGYALKLNVTDQFMYSWARKTDQRDH
jgi:hypothetical protein